MADRDAIEIRIGNDIVVGLMPRLPLRQLLHRSYQRALGYTSDADREALAARKAGDPMPEPSEEADPYAAGCALVAVIGRPHLKWGERPILVVELHASAALGDEALLAVLRGKVPSWWLPDEVIRVPRMPLSPTGKIDKTRLRVEYGGGA